MDTIQDITETEEWIVRTTLKERYGRDIELQYADAEIRLKGGVHYRSPNDESPTHAVLTALRGAGVPAAACGSGAGHTTSTFSAPRPDCS